MKRVFLVSLLVAVLSAGNVWGARDVGGTFGAFQTARGIGMGDASFIGALGIADATSAFGMVRYGLADYLEGRLKLGIRDGGAYDATIAIGADVTYQWWSDGPATTHPIDLAFGGMIEYFSIEYNDPGLPVMYDESIFQVGGYAVGSYPFLLENGMTISPYGRFNLRIEDINPDDPQFDHTTELEFGFNAGAKLEINQTLSAYGEVQLDGNDGVFLGLDFILL